MSDWQPIETAPLGEYVRLHHPSWRHEFVGQRNGAGMEVYVDWGDTGWQTVASHWRLLDTVPPGHAPLAGALGPSRGACWDCKRRYGDEYGFPDLVVPHDIWRQISPTGDEGGLLCPSCICARLHKAGIKCEGAFMSGPLVGAAERPLHERLQAIHDELETCRARGLPLPGWNSPPV